MNSKVQAHKEICEYLNKLYEKKNHDYGDSFHQSVLKDESIRDTLLDLANYAIMTVMEMDAVRAQHNLAKEWVAKAGRLS